MNKLKRNKNNSSNERTFLIEKIVGKKQEQGVSKYKVKWVGYDDKDNTWEPLVNLKGCEDLIADYEKSLIQEERILGKKLKRDNNFNEFEATPLPSSEKKYNRYKEIPATNTKQTKLQRTKSNGSPILKSNSLRSSVLSPTRKEDVETVTIPPNLEDKPSRNKLKEAVDKSIQEAKHISGVTSNLKKPTTPHDVRQNLNKSLPCIQNDSRANDELLNSEEGLLGYDIPLRIITGRQHKEKEREILCLVEWKARSNKFTPKPSYYTNSQIKEVDKDILIEFYESRLKFPDKKKE